MVKGVLVLPPKAGAFEAGRKNVLVLPPKIPKGAVAEPISVISSEPTSAISSEPTSAISSEPTSLISFEPTSPVAELKIKDESESEDDWGSWKAEPKTDDADSPVFVLQPEIVSLTVERRGKVKVPPLIYVPSRFAASKAKAMRAAKAKVAGYQYYKVINGVLTPVDEIGEPEGDIFEEILEEPSWNEDDMEDAMEDGMEV